LIFLGVDREEGSQSSNDILETWFEECEATIDRADRLDMALRAAEAVEAVLRSLLKHHSSFGQKQDNGDALIDQNSIVSLLLAEQIVQSKSLRDQLATSQVKAERIATVVRNLLDLMWWLSTSTNDL
jgi:hypothetical protein